MEIAYNSSNPYIFTIAVDRGEDSHAAETLSLPYDPYRYPNWQFCGLIYQYLKNVRPRFAKTSEVIRRVGIASKMKDPTEYKVMRWTGNDYTLKAWAIIYGVIDSMVAFYGLQLDSPNKTHVSPICFSNSFVIVSGVRSDARRESSETLSFQGLSSLVWVLVGVSLLVVTLLVTYTRFETEKKDSQACHVFSSWMNSVFIFAADILNNCVAGMVRPEPRRLLRSWWLLAVAFLMEFWSAGMKSDLLLDHSSFVDSLEDLLTKPDLVCVVSKYGVEPFDLKDGPRRETYRKMRRSVSNVRDDNSNTILSRGKGVVTLQELNVALPNQDLFSKLKAAKRKLYVGKTRYRERYTYTIFNKRLPRAIREDIDYLALRITETQQLEMRNRRFKFESRQFVFDAADKSATMPWSGKSFEFMWPVFRLWMIGISLGTIVLCVEVYCHTR